MHYWGSYRDVSLCEKGILTKLSLWINHKMDFCRRFTTARYWQKPERVIYVMDPTQSNIDYSIWPKVCGKLTMAPISAYCSKGMVLIWCCPFVTVTASTFLGRLFGRHWSKIVLESGTRTLVRTGTDVNQWGLKCSWFSSSCQRCSLELRLRAPCSPLEGFQTNLSKPCLLGLHFMYRGIIILEQV